MSNPALLSPYVDNNPSESGLDVQHSRTFVEGLRLTIVQGDIAISETDAIVVPTDESLGLSGMVAARIASAAGRGLNREIDDALANPANIFPTANNNNNNINNNHTLASLPYNITRVDASLMGTTASLQTHSIHELAKFVNIPYLTAFSKVMKREEITPTKEIIVLERDGTYHRNQNARNFLKILPPTISGKNIFISPSKIPAGAEVFVQSTNQHRKIPNMSSILLEGATTTTTTTAAVTAPLSPTTNRTATGRRRRNFDTCDTVMVDGHSLPAKNVIFVVSPVRSEYHSESDAEDALRQAVKNVLMKCNEEGISTVTLPSIGSGLAGYDKEKAANYIISAVGEYLVEVVGIGNQRQRIKEICFCLYDDESLDAYIEGIEIYDSRSTSSSRRTKRQRIN